MPEEPSAADTTLPAAAGGQPAVPKGGKPTQGKSRRKAQPKLHCARCRELLPRQAFSKNQLAKTSDKRRCATCIDDTVAETSPPEAVHAIVKGTPICRYGAACTKQFATGPARCKFMHPRAKGKMSADAVPWIPSDVALGAAAAAVLPAQKRSESAPQPDRGSTPKEVKGGNGVDRWWRVLTDTDPISLEPLRKLKAPPFDLPADKPGGTVATYFDSRILASYLIATGRFAHPTSRRSIEPEECTKLDAHLRQYRLGRPGVHLAWEHRAEYEVNAPRSSNSTVESRREEAQAVLNSLFGVVTDPQAELDQGMHGSRGGFQSRDVPLAGAAYIRGDSSSSNDSWRRRDDPITEDGLTMIDDDVGFTNFPAFGSSTNAAADADAEFRSAFPSLPSTAAPRAPHALSFAQRAAAAAKKPTPVPAPAPPSGAAQRAAQLAAAFESDPRGSTHSALQAAQAFDPETLKLARKAPQFVTELEAIFDGFLEAPSCRRLALRPMPRWQRAVVHELAKHYGLLTGSYGDEPSRRVDIFRTTMTSWPGLRLSNAIHAPDSMQAKRTDVPTTTMGPEVQYTLKFTGVAAEDRSVAAAALRPFSSDCALQWAENRSGSFTGRAIFTDRTRWVDALVRIMYRMLPTHRCISASCTDQGMLGGGRRGKYSVVAEERMPSQEQKAGAATIGAPHRPLEQMLADNHHRYVPPALRRHDVLAPHDAANGNQWCSDRERCTTVAFAGSSLPIGPLQVATEAQLLSEVVGESVCCICFEKLLRDDGTITQAGLFRLPCDHIFHERCISQWVEHKSDCPVCRST